MSLDAQAIVAFIVCVIILVPLFMLGLRQAKRADAASNDDVGSNFLAGMAFLFAFLASPLGILLAHLSLRQIAVSGQSAVRLATWALYLAYVLTLVQLGALLWVTLNSR